MGNYLKRAAPEVVLEAVRLVVNRIRLDQAMYLTDDEVRKVRKFLEGVLEPSEKPAVVDNVLGLLLDDKGKGKTDDEPKDDKK